MFTLKKRNNKNVVFFLSPYARKYRCQAANPLIVL